jgi:hypothetical protein
MEKEGAELHLGGNLVSTHVGRKGLGQHEEQQG